MLLEDDSRIAANSATRRDGNVIEFDRAVYSPCPLCDGGQGRALVADQGAAGRSATRTAQTVTYRDARLEMFGLPIAYTPWFRHPAPGREAAVRLSDADLRLDLRARPGRPDPLLLRARPELRRHHRADHHPEWRHGAGRRVPAPAQQRLHAARRRRHLRGSRRERRRQRAGPGFRGYLHGFGGYSVSDHSQAGYDLFLSSDNTFLDRYQINDADVLRNRVFLEGFEAPQFLVAERLLLPGPAAVRRPGHDPRGPAAGRDPHGQRPDALGLLLHRRLQHPGADPQPGPRHAAHLQQRRLDPALCRRRSATSTASTSACAATSTTPRAIRRPSARRAATRPTGRVLPRAHRRLELAAGRPDRQLGARGRAHGQRQPGADLRQHPQDPERGQLGLRVRRDQPVRARPLSRARPDRHRLARRLRPALQLAGAARHRAQRHLRPELLVHRERVHSAEFRRCRTISPTMSARSTSGPARCST